MKYILGVYGTASFNLETQRHDYNTKISVSKDVIDWLNNHDIEITGDGERLYILNNIKYIFLGVDLDMSLDSFDKGKEELLIHLMQKYQHMYDIIYLKIEQLLRKEFEKQHEPNVQHIKKEDFIS